MSIKKNPLVFALLLVLFEFFLFLIYEVSGLHFSKLLFYLGTQFIFGFLYCLLFKENISPEFSEAITKRYMLFYLIILFLNLIMWIYEHGFVLSGFAGIEEPFIIVILVLPLAFFFLYFSTYLILIYSSRFYNFLRNRFIKS